MRSKLWKTRNDRQAHRRHLMQTTLQKIAARCFGRRGGAGKRAAQGSSLAGKDGTCSR